MSSKRKDEANQELTIFEPVVSSSIPLLESKCLLNPRWPRKELL
jgi:hypothetical protein